jgi:WD40 repeat protein
MSEIDGDIRRRHLLVIATGDYDDPVWRPLPVADEVRVWTDWLTDDTLAERRFTHLARDLAENPRFPRLLEFLNDEMDQIRSSDALVVVVTGHGMVVDRVHRIVLANAGRPPLERHSLRTEQLISFLKGTEVEHALVVIDTCHAGEVTRQMLYDKGLPAGWIGIAAAAPEGEARAGAVAEAVRAFLNPGPGDERHGGPNQPYFLASDLVQFITDQLGEDQDVVTFPRQARSRPSPCLPNPAFVSAHEGMVGTAEQRQDLALREEDLAAHWGPRARGVQHEGEAGWLFTGRARLMRDLIGVARGQPGTYLVTGVAGSGKSAVLARLVTLSDPDFRARHLDLVAAVPEQVRPEPGDVDVAIHARSKTAAEILDQLCTAFGVTLDAGDMAKGLKQQQQAHIEALRRRLGNLGGATTIVIDALDEANDPRDVLTNVLVPFVTGWKEPKARLIVGVRSADDPLGPRVGGAAPTLVGACRALLGANELRVDTAPYWKNQDLVDYVAGILTTPAPGRNNTPYATAAQRTRALAMRMAQLVGTSYLVAQIVARQLAAAETLQDPDDPAWQSIVSAGLSSVLQVELTDAFPDEDDRRRAVTVLRAASLAFGQGIPWRRIWPAVATALADDGEDYGDSDIRWLLGHRIGGYLVRDLDDDGTTVYRPFHHALTQALALASPQNDSPPRDPLSKPLERGRTPGKLPQEYADRYLAGQHGRITQALTALLPTNLTDTIVEPDRYLRRHLVEHAAASGRLDQLLENARFLVITDPDALLPLLTNTKHPAGLVYRRVAHQLRGQTQQERAVLLELAAHLIAEKDVALPFESLMPARPWRVKWAQTSSASPHTIITAQSVPISAVALGELKGRSVIVAVMGGAVHTWDMVTTTQISGPPTEHTSWATVVAVGELEGRLVIVSGSPDRRVRAWDLDTGTPIGSPMAGFKRGVTAVAVGKFMDRPVVVAGSDNGTARVWDLASGAKIGPPLTGQTGSVITVAVVELQGRPVIFSSNRDGAIRLWDPSTGAHIRTPLIEPTGCGRAMAVAELEGRPVIVCGHPDGTLQVLDLATGAKMGAPLTGHARAVNTVAAGELEGRPVFVSGSDDRTVQVWDLATGAKIGTPLTGHTHAVETVAVGELEGRPIIISGGRDGTIRAWDLVTSTPIDDSPLTLQAGPVYAVGDAELEGRSVIVSEFANGTVCVWDIDSGNPIGVASIASTHFARLVTVVAVGEFTGRPAIVAGDQEGTVRMWDLNAAHSWIESLPTDSTGAVTAVAVSEVDGRSVIVAGDQRGNVRVWDPVTGTSMASPRAHNTGAVTAVAVSEVDGRSVIVFGDYGGTVCVWDPATGTSIASPPPHYSDWRHDGGWVKAVAVSELEGRPVIISATSYGETYSAVEVWDLATCTPIGSPLTATTAQVTALAVGAMDGRPVIASGSTDGTARLWDLAVRQPLAALPLGAPVGAICARGPLISLGVGNALIVLELHPEMSLPT